MRVYRDVQSVDETGDWGVDNGAGKALARAYIELARITDNPLAISSALRDMVKGGRWGAVEVGFAHEIAESLMLRR